MTNVTLWLMLLYVAWIVNYMYFNRLWNNRNEIELANKAYVVILPCLALFLWNNLCLNQTIEIYTGLHGYIDTLGHFPYPCCSINDLLPLDWLAWITSLTFNSFLVRVLKQDTALALYRRYHPRLWVAGSMM